ncbi:hypothetical protein GCM10010145_66800 [Streptomyces ruber]|uniref:DUF418 domain-containing protein n=2 Tax=Streptomyces TaxID=1883 RepID=A0A918F011_9ACTN|nr:DUF418 domain-containing protein [Streptomyces ruber]GGQ88046.1 hypothetical protein GCM10010145_66800 [Streptomyces ruber]
MHEVDVLRGFALSGILAVNALLIAGPHVGAGGGEPVPSPVDEGVEWLITALAAGKFHLLFSFLFGYSFVLQRQSADRAGHPFVSRHLRRLGCLFALGLAHGTLLFPGDVLMSYAVLGLALFAVQDIAPRRLLQAAAGLVVLTVVCLLAYGALTLAVAEPPSRSEVEAALEPWTTAYRGDSGTVIGAHLRELRASLMWSVVYGAGMLAAFLAGLVAGRRGLLADTGRHRATLVRTVTRCLPVGLAGGIVMAVCRNGPLDARWYHVGSAVGVLTAPALSAAYVCGLLLLLRTGPGRRVGRALAPAGRTALTNYLGQSLILALVFTGHGLARYGHHGAAAVLAGCLVLYAGQLALSAWLTARYRYGPAEWLLRTATLARRP